MQNHKKGETRATPPLAHEEGNTFPGDTRERTTKKPHRTTTHTNQRSTENVLLERRLEIMALLPPKIRSPGQPPTRQQGEKHIPKGTHERELPKIPTQLPHTQIN